MSWFLGAGVGFLRGGPIGAVVGGAIQHFVSKKIKKKIGKVLPGVADHPLFVVCLTALLTRFALLQGDGSGESVRIIHDFFIKNLGYGKADLEPVNRIIEETRKVRPHAQPLAEEYKKATQGHYPLLALALGYQICLTGGEISSALQGEINDIAKYLGVSPEDHNRLRKKYLLDALKTPYSILGIKSSDSEETAKQAYRRLALKYHPDRVAHLGDEEVQEAHIRFLEIQKAYQELESMRGF